MLDLRYTIINIVIAVAFLLFFIGIFIAFKSQHKRQLKKKAQSPLSVAYSSRDITSSNFAELPLNTPERSSEQPQRKVR